MRLPARDEDITAHHEPAKPTLKRTQLTFLAYSAHDTRSSSRSANISCELAVVSYTFFTADFPSPANAFPSSEPIEPGNGNDGGGRPRSGFLSRLQETDHSTSRTRPRRAPRQSTTPVLNFGLIAIPSLRSQNLAPQAGAPHLGSRTAVQTAGRIAGSKIAWRPSRSLVVARCIICSVAFSSVVRVVLSLVFSPLVSHFRCSLFGGFESVSCLRVCVSY